MRRLFQIQSLSEPAGKWAQNALSFSNKKVVLNDESELYNIKISAPKLTEWYQERVQLYKVRKKDLLNLFML